MKKLEMNSIQGFQSELQAVQTRHQIAYRVAREVRDTAKQQGELALSLLDGAAKIARGETSPPTRGIDLRA